jgi:hypothetical protein
MNCTTSYFVFAPGHRRNAREAKKIPSVVKVSRDEKIGECVAR